MVEQRRRANRRRTNSPGAHYLRADIAGRVVQEARVDSNDLVLDLGAGWGALTGPLARTGARVIAVERDPISAAGLRKRFSAIPSVTVVHADIRTFPLPRRAFCVVANIPFGVTKELLHRLLDPRGSRLSGADLVVQREAATRFAAWAKSPAGAWWGVRYRLRRGLTIGPDSFTPPPAVHAAVLVIRRHPLTVESEATLAVLLRQIRRDPNQRVRSLLAGRVSPRRLRAAGVPPTATVGSLDARQLRAITALLVT